MVVLPGVMEGGGGVPVVEGFPSTAATAVAVEAFDLIEAKAVDNSGRVKAGSAGL